MIHPANTASDPAVRQATHEVWEDFGQPLRDYLRKRIGNAADADDVLQEVFLRIHTRLHTLRDEEKLPMWLYQIAKNAVTDYYRRKSPSAPLSPELLCFNGAQETDAEAKLAEQMPVFAYQ